MRRLLHLHPALALMMISLGMMVVSSSAKPQKRQDAGVTCISMDMAMTVGQTWSERCRSCECTVDGPRCQGPVCTLPYRPWQEVYCAEWEDNGCCCKAEGCKLTNGTIAPVGSLVPHKDDPCVTCKCKSYPYEECYRERCPTINCGPGAHAVPDGCCLKCFVPPIQPQTPAINASDILR